LTSARAHYKNKIIYAKHKIKSVKLSLAARYIVCIISCKNASFTKNAFHLSPRITPNIIIPGVPAAIRVVMNAAYLIHARHVIMLAINSSYNNMQLKETGFVDV